MGTIDIAQKVIGIEIEALEALQSAIGSEFETIVDLIVSCRGKVVLCGIGKSGHVAKKISATLASLGTPSFYLHPAEAQHGDMGMVSKGDVVLLISNSGETDEILKILVPLRVIGATTVAITAGESSTLASECDYVQIMPKVTEACSLNLAPTSSTTAVMAYGDALAVAASGEYGFTKEDFGLFHPAGTLGRRLLVRVEDLMAKGDDIPVVTLGCTMSEAILEMSEKKLGMVIIVDDNRKLCGLLTDGDLRRAIEKKIDMYQGKVDEAMTVSPRAIQKDLLAVGAMQQLKELKMNNFPVVDEENRVIGALTWQMIIREGIL